MIERVKKARRVNIRRLRPHVRAILQDDIVGRSEPPAYEELRAMLLALATLTGKGFVEFDASMGIIASCWENHPARESTDEELYRCVEAFARDELLEPWATLSEGAIHGVVTAMLAVVQRSRQTLEETRAQYADTWAYYEAPPELLAD